MRKPLPPLDEKNKSFYAELEKLCFKYVVSHRHFTNPKEIHQLTRKILNHILDEGAQVMNVRQRHADCGGVVTAVFKHYQCDTCKKVSDWVARTTEGEIILLKAG